MYRESVLYGDIIYRFGVQRVSVFPFNNCAWLISLMVFWYLHVCLCNFIISDYKLNHVNCFDKRNDGIKTNTRKFLKSAYVFHFFLASLPLQLINNNRILPNPTREMGGETFTQKSFTEKTNLSQLSHSRPDMWVSPAKSSRHVFSICHWAQTQEIRGTTQPPHWLGRHIVNAHYS